MHTSKGKGPQQCICEQLWTHHKKDDNNTEHTAGADRDAHHRFFQRWPHTADAEGSQQTGGQRKGGSLTYAVGGMSCCCVGAMSMGTAWSGLHHNISRLRSLHRLGHTAKLMWTLKNFHCTLPLWLPCSSSVPGTQVARCQAGAWRTAKASFSTGLSLWSPEFSGRLCCWERLSRWQFTCVAWLGADYLLEKAEASARSRQQVPVSVITLGGVHTL